MITNQMYVVVLFIGFSCLKKKVVCVDAVRALMEKILHLPPEQW